jgi:hypothetical protein
LDFWSNPPSELAPADDQNLGGAFETWDTSDGRGAPLESCDEGGDGHVRIARQARLRRERDNRLKNSPRRHRLLVNIGGEQLDPGRVVGGLSRFDAEVNMEQDILHRGVALHPALLRRRQFDEAGDLRSGASGAVVVPWRVARKERDLPRGRTCSISGRTKSLAWVVGSLALPWLPNGRGEMTSWTKPLSCPSWRACCMANQTPEQLGRRTARPVSARRPDLSVRDTRRRHHTRGRLLFPCATRVR